MEIKQADNSLYYLTTGQVESLEQYKTLLCRWNGLSLIAKSTVSDVFGWHILDALSILFLVKQLQGYKFIDFGAGGGVLGVSLAFAGVENVFLVERSQVKFEFLKNVLKFPNVFLNCDFLNYENSQPYLLMARGVGSMTSVLNQAIFNQPKLKNGKFLLNKAIFLKSCDVRHELRECKKYWNFKYKIYPREALAKGQIVFLEDVAPV